MLCGYRALETFGKVIESVSLSLELYIYIRDIPCNFQMFLQFFSISLHHIVLKFWYVLVHKSRVNQYDALAISGSLKLCPKINGMDVLRPLLATIISHIPFWLLNSSCLLLASYASK